MKLGNIAGISLSAALMAAIGGGTAMADDRANKIDLNKTFTMQVQQTPISDPTNPAYRNVDVDCNLMTLNPRSGKPIPSAQFVAQFDPNGNDFPPTKGWNDPVYNTGLQHIGGGTPKSHQLCVPQSEVFGSRGRKKRNTPYTMNFRGKTYYLSAPFGDYRYCPVFAAAAVCTTNTSDDKNIPDFYEIAPSGDMTINPARLGTIENPPKYKR